MFKSLCGIGRNALYFGALLLWAFMHMLYIIAPTSYVLGWSRSIHWLIIFLIPVVPYTIWVVTRLPGKQWIQKLDAYRKQGIK